MRWLLASMSIRRHRGILAAEGVELRQRFVKLPCAHRGLMHALQLVAMVRAAVQRPHPTRTDAAR
jgi:hypothetical protein